MDNKQRRTFLALGEIPPGTHVLGIPVKTPHVIITGEWDETGEGIPALEEIVTVYVELDKEEIDSLRTQGQVATNEFAHRVSHLAAEALGGYVKKWND